MANLLHIVCTISGFFNPGRSGRIDNEANYDIILEKTRKKKVINFIFASYLPGETITSAENKANSDSDKCIAFSLSAKSNMESITKQPLVPFPRWTTIPFKLTIVLVYINIGRKQKHKINDL
jgi:hypothetical protein